MIPGGDEGRARRWSIPGGGSDDDALLAGSGARCSVTAREDGGRPRGAFLPADLAESPAAGGQKQGRSEAERDGENARGLKCPSRQLLLCDAGHRSRNGETRVFAGWGRDFAAPPKIFCGPGQYAGTDRAGFSAPTRILAVIFRVGADAGLLQLL